jgi:thiamine-phosphate pyrophosphorylase
MSESRLYLVSPLIADAGAFTPSLGEACAAGEVAAVLLRFADADERAGVNRIKELAPIAQKQGCAIIVMAPPQVAVRGGADGVHLPGRDMGPLKRALTALKPERIVGAGDVRSRHDAMQAGETGVDYVMFGEPRPDGSLPPLDTTLERVAWWSEIFEVPCVAFAASFEAAGELAAAKPEFIALGDAVWAHPGGAGEAVLRALGAIGGTVAAP